jgi:hypothetical protein
MCDSCSKIFDDECLRETTALREYLKKEERRICNYMDKIVKWITAERAVKWENHDCQSSRLRVLGVAKTKKLGLYSKPARKSKPKVVRRAKKVAPPEPGWWIDSRDGKIHFSRDYAPGGKFEFTNQFQIPIQDGKTDSTDLPSGNQEF